MITFQVTADGPPQTKWTRWRATHDGAVHQHDVFAGVTLGDGKLPL